MELIKLIKLDTISCTKKKWNKYAVTLIFIIIAAFIRVSTYLASLSPYIIEKLYSSTIYPYIGTILGKITAIFPFSLGELIILTLPLIFISFIIYLIIGQGVFKNKLSRIIHIVIRAISLIYILFYLLWGFNYFREDYITISGWESSSPSFEDLTSLTQGIILKMNELRNELDEDESGVFIVNDDFINLNHIALDGFKDYSVGSYSLDRIKGRAKPVLLSDYMSYTGITGVYFPFTGEANVNTAVPHVTLLSTISHEIAHHKGFAKEDEANFIAYKANVSNPDKRFQYSGYYLAMSHLLNEIYTQDKDEYNRLYNILSDKIKIDIKNSREYWKLREGKMEETMTNMNDSYLKSNNQEQGIKSYNGVVKLLLLEHLNTKGID